MAEGTIRTSEAAAEAAAGDLLQAGVGEPQANVTRLSSLAPVPGSGDHDGLAELAEADAKAAVAADGALHVADGIRARAL